MRKIIGAAFVSLDGVMQAPGGPDEDTQCGFDQGGWMAAIFEEAVGAQVDTFFKPPFDLLLGRRTYDIFASHWPFMPQDDPIAATFATIDKFVLSRSDIALDWAGSHRLADMDALARLKAGDGPNLVIQGSSTLYPELITRGLLDRLILMIAPVALGSGKRLFGEGTPPTAFKLAEQRLTPGGMIMATYEPAGAVQRGSFELEHPTEQEMARQQKMREGSW